RFGRPPAPPPAPVRGMMPTPSPPLAPKPLALSTRKRSPSGEPERGRRRMSDCAAAGEAGAARANVTAAASGERSENLMLLPVWLGARLLRVKAAAPRVHRASSRARNV